MAIKKQTFMKGVLVIMLSQILVKVFGFIYRVILTNFESFADQGNSYYGSGYTVYTFILAIATMGIPNTISKLVSEKNAIGDKRGAHRIFRVAMVLFTIIGSAFAVSLFLGSGIISTYILKNPGVKYTLMALSPAIIFVSMSAVLRGYFVGMQNMVQYSKTQVIEQIVNSVFSVVFVVMLVGNTPEIMAAGSTLATTVSAAIAFMYMYRYYSKNKKDIWEEIKKSDKFAVSSTKSIVKKIISYVIPISFGSIVVALANLIDVVTVMNGLQKFGYDIVTANEKFGIIIGKVEILLSLPLAINVAFAVALVPFISAAIAKGNKEEAKEKINYSLKVSSIIALPCALGLSALATNILLMLFPNASIGAELLQIQAWTVVFSVLSQTASGSLQGLGKLYAPGACLLVGATVKILLNVILIPIYGEIIPSISTVAYQAVTFTLLITILFKTLKEKPNLLKLFFKPLFATIIMGIYIVFAKKVVLTLNIGNTIATLSIIISAAILYFIVIIVTRTLSEKEIKQLPMGDILLKITRKRVKK